MATVTIELNDDLVALLQEGRQPSDQPLERTHSGDTGVECFRRGRISTGRACELLSLDRVTFARRADELDIPYFNMTVEDWEVEKATIDRWLRSS